MPGSGAPWFGFRLLSLVVGLMLLTSSGLAGTNAMVGDVALLIRTYLRHHGQYTQVPTKPFLGAHPGRDPLGRGGMWKTRTVKAAKDLEEAYEAPLAEAHGPYARAAAETVVMGGGQHGGLHSLSVEPSPGKRRDPHFGRDLRVRQRVEDVVQDDRFGDHNLQVGYR